MLMPEEYRSATDFLYRTREDWKAVGRLCLELNPGGAK